MAGLRASGAFQRLQAVLTVSWKTQEVQPGPQHSKKGRNKREGEKAPTLFKGVGLETVHTSRP
jgi:hypothetical protein